MSKKHSTIFDSYLSIVAKKETSVVADDYNEIANGILKVLFVELFTEDTITEFITHFEDSLETDGIEIGELMEKAAMLVEVIARRFAPQMVVNQNKEDDTLLVGIIIGHTLCHFHDRMKSIIRTFHPMYELMPEFASEKMYKFFTEDLKEAVNG